MIPRRETDAERVQRACDQYVRRILNDRQAIADAVTRMQGLSALDRLTEIMHQAPETK